MIFEIILKGRVQGVGCRYYCGKVASAMNISGSATNLMDGSVRILIDVENREAAESFLNALRTDSFNYNFRGVITSAKLTETGSITISGDYIW